MRWERTSAGRMRMWLALNFASLAVFVGVSFVLPLPEFRKDVALFAAAVMAGMNWALIEYVGKSSREGGESRLRDHAVVEKASSKKSARRG